MTASSYPSAPRADTADEIHGHLVADPYRWLEDSDSEQTVAWQEAQDALYAAKRAQLPGVDAFAARVSELMGAGAVSPPIWRGDRQFFTRRAPGQEHAVLYTSAPGDEGPDGTGRVLVDPIAIDPAGTTTLDRWQPDREGRLMAYQVSEGGREEPVLRVFDVVTSEEVDGPIDRARYTDIAWLPGGKAYYYARRLAPGQVPADEEQYHRRVYLHRVGTSPDDDVVIHGEGMDKTTYFGVSVSVDGRWLIIEASAGTEPRNDAWIADLRTCDPAQPDLRVMQEGVDAQAYVRGGRDGLLYVLTDRDAPRGRVMTADSADPEFPGYASWRELLRQDDEAVLTGMAILDGAELDRPVLVVSRDRHAVSEVTVHDLADGSRAGQVELPGLGHVSGIHGRPEGGHEAWFTYTDYTTPALVGHWDAQTGASRTWASPAGTVELPDVRTEQVAFTSADGTTVRMLVISGADGAQPRQPRPAIVYGYGGFNVSLNPGYSASTLAWVAAGGVYAVVGLRGGSEEGEEWHRAGMREKKQNVFDDYASAATELIAQGWTTASQLACWGGSNGGLLVGVAITQRPDLYAAAVCSAPLLDMIRYELFGLGESWNDEYGSVADAEEFGWLLGYSPYHHVEPGTAYPAMLFTTFGGDTRVDPLHARKLCAALQHATSAPLDERPVLLRHEKNVGHGARAVSRTVGVASEELAFVAAYTGLAL
jgi:prolyl oligopeptidase